MLVPTRALVCLAASAAAFRVAPRRETLAFPRLSRGTPLAVATVALAPERWSWSGPVVAAPAAAAAAGKCDPVGAEGAQKRLVFFLAFNAGLADLVLFRKHSCFATMMTGNLIKGVCAGLGARWADAVFFSQLTAVYLSGVGAFRALDARLGREASPAVNRVLAPAVLALFAAADAFAAASPRAAALWCAAGFGLVNSVSLDVLLTITTMLTVHMHKLTNLAVDAVGLAGPAARGRAKLSDMNKRSIAVISAFALGIAAGTGICANFPAFVHRGFSTALGASYALMLLTHDNGRLCLDTLGRTLLGSDHPMVAKK